MVTSFGLGHLPYDTLVYIFQELDRTSLWAACLSSRHLNELATPLLYRNVTVLLLPNVCNPKQPFGAFERRPFLRQVVRSVTLQPVLSFRQNIPENLPFEIASQLRSLPNVERLSFLPGWCEDPELAQYLGVLSDWPKLRRIDTSLDVMEPLATLKHLHSRLLAVTTLSMRWSWRSKTLQNDLVFWSKTLRDLTLIGFPSKKTPDYLVQFRNLTRLSLKECWPSESPQLLGNLYQLHYLEDFEVTINIDSTFTSFMPTGLKNLKSLDIYFCYPKRESKSPLVNALEVFVNALAGESYLHRLKLKPVLDVKTHFRADRFMGKVLQRHGDTLRRLSLGQFHPSSSVFRKMFNCRYMKRLTIGITRTFANDLSLYLVSTSQLEAMTLCFPNEAVHFSRSTIHALLGQTSSPLATIKVRITASWQGQTRITRWTSTLGYDSDIKQVIRVISGPKAPIQPEPLVNLKSLYSC